METFEIRHHRENYLVRADTKKTLNVLRAWVRKWQGHNPTEPSGVTYTPQDIERLERDGRAKRGTLERLPDFHSLSNILRTVGAYLDRKDAHLLQLHKTELNMMILYQTRQGHPEIEERTVASFYDLSLQMYQRREKKPSV